MLVDSSEIGQTTIRADVCVIGCGAAGITIAREFVGTHHQVVVLEGGGLTFEPESQEPYQSEIVGLPHSGIHVGRARAAGGTTLLWAGQCLPFFDIDFEKRDWVPHSGWPIKRSDLTPFYQCAESVMQVPASTYDAASWPNQHLPNTEPASSSVATHYSQFTMRPNFWDKYGSKLRNAQNVRVITHAQVATLDASPGADSVRSVACRGAGGRAFDVQARFVIVCCGGIETARLLLVSDSVEKTGIGNRHDVVGRYFQDHPGVIFPIRVHRRRELSAAYDCFAKNNIRFGIRLNASDKFQRDEKILHVGAGVFYPVTEADPVGAAKLILKSIRSPQLRREVPAAIRTVLRRPDRVVRGAWQYYVRGQPAAVGVGPPFLGAGGEQAPNPDSRVTLSNERDSFGIRRTRLDWRLSELETRSTLTFVTIVQEMWSAQGLATIDVDSVPMQGRETGKFGGYIDSNHHMGTARMGSDPTSSVVDSDCRVHGYDNLYIASGAVFPTGGQSNPTFTVLALSLRLADRIKNLLSAV